MGVIIIKRLNYLIFLMMLILSVSACSKSPQIDTVGDSDDYEMIDNEKTESDEIPKATSTEVKSEMKNIFTNSRSNLVNGGTVVKYGDKIIISMPHDIMLTLFDPKEGKTTTISKEDCGDSIIIYGDRLIFASGMGGVNSMNIDGSNKVNIVDSVFCSHLTIEGEELFYINSSDKNIYKMSIDGKENSKIVDGDDCYRFLIYNNKIYYAACYYPDENDFDYGLFSCNLDGSGKKKLYSNINQVYIFTIENDKIIFSDKEVIREMNLDGTGIREIYRSDEKFGIRSINVDEDMVYFIDKRVIYRIKTDGTGLEKILEGYDPRNLHIVDDWIYFVTTSYENYVESHIYYRVPKNGGEVEKVVESTEIDY